MLENIIAIIENNQRFYDVEGLKDVLFLQKKSDLI